MKKYKSTKNISISDFNHKKSFFSDRRKILLMSGLIIFLMVGSILGVMLYEDGQSQKVEENGYSFVFDNQKGGWATKINGQDTAFAYLPSELNNIPREAFLNLGKGTKTYVTFNSNEFSEGSNEILILGGFLGLSGKKANAACAIDTKECNDLPIVNCNSTLTNTDIVYIYIGNETKIYNQPNCVSLEAKAGDELKLINLFVYQLFGIVK